MEHFGSESDNNELELTNDQLNSFIDEMVGGTPGDEPAGAEDLSSFEDDLDWNAITAEPTDFDLRLEDDPSDSEDDESEVSGVDVDDEQDEEDSDEETDESEEEDEQEEDEEDTDDGQAAEDDTEQFTKRTIEEIIAPHLEEIPEELREKVSQIAEAVRRKYQADFTRKNQERIASYEPYREIEESNKDVLAQMVADHKRNTGEDVPTHTFVNNALQAVHSIRTDRQTQAALVLQFADELGWTVTTSSDDSDEGLSQEQSEQQAIQRMVAEQVNPLQAEIAQYRTQAEKAQALAQAEREQAETERIASTISTKFNATKGSGLYRLTDAQWGIAEQMAYQKALEKGTYEVDFDEAAGVLHKENLAIQKQFVQSKPKKTKTVGRRGSTGKSPKPVKGTTLDDVRESAIDEMAARFGIEG